MFKVMVKIWTNDRYDYMIQEYSGVTHDNYEAAELELYEARKIEGLEAYIKEVSN